MLFQFLSCFSKSRLIIEQGKQYHQQTRLFNVWLFLVQSKTRQKIENAVFRHFITSTTCFLSCRENLGALKFAFVAVLWRGVFFATGFILL
jgi:hypothetical protein